MTNSQRMINFGEHTNSSSDSEYVPDSDVIILDMRSRNNSQNIYLRMLDVVSVPTSELIYYQFSSI